MSERSKKSSTMRGGRATAITKQVKGLLTSLAIPTILTACAPVPHMHSSSSQAPGSPRTVLYVGPKEKKGEGADEQAEAGKDSLDSPASRYIPLPAEIPLHEKLHLHAKHQFTLEELVPKGRRGLLKNRKEPLVADMLPRPPQVAVVNPPPTPVSKSFKDGIWERVRRRLMLIGIEQERVTAEVEKLRRSPGMVHSLSKRAEPFLFYIVDEIERRGLPMDLVMVPMVESGFEPAAVSPKQAAGIWQFIPSTATNYGLKLVDGYDGRYDLYASTKAALKYLARLQGMFGGDWLLALAAYNAGEGAVQRAVQANQKAGLPTSFWDLDLPVETKAYVPKILALSRVIADPLSHGVSLRKVSPFPYLARVEVSGDTVQLAQAVEGMGMSWEEFASLNPAFKPDVPPVAPFNVLLPLEKAEMLAASLQGAKLIAARKYVVKKGETLVVIARRQGVPPMKLAEWNGLKADSRVKPGQELIIFPV